ncbi:MAG: HEPN domain-containing protein [Spirochaetota bacterium]|jgi:HEPN domain-containing protein|nr:HEPN domain-containing protein [Spirochaetota bacterium]
MAKQANTPRNWYLLAERDMDVADHLANTMRPVPTAPIAFFCQQAVEKYLKGILAIFGDDPPFIHDLPELCKLAEKHHPECIQISPLCTIITQFSTQPRYDLGISLSEEDMRLVLAHAKTIRSFLQKEIPSLFLGES